MDRREVSARATLHTATDNTMAVATSRNVAIRMIVCNTRCGGSMRKEARLTTFALGAAGRLLCGLRRRFNVELLFENFNERRPRAPANLHAINASSAGSERPAKLDDLSAPVA